MTTIREQAVRWAKRKALFEKGSKPILNEYEMIDSAPELNVRNFGDDLNSWIDFVCQCRDGNSE